MSDVQAIVFDIGRVLITWDPEGCYDRWIGADARKRLFAEVPLHEANAAIDRGAPFHATIAALAGDHPGWRDEIMLWHDRWREMVTPGIDGSMRVLEALLAGPRPVYALTNFGRETFALAQVMYPLLGRFDEAFVSGHLRLLKPEPEIYAAVERGTGLPGEALFFTDDSPDNIAAARARGWQVHLFDGPEGLETALRERGLL